MKKLLSLLLVTAMVLSMAACGNTENANTVEIEADGSEGTVSPLDSSEASSKDTENSTDKESDANSGNIASGASTGDTNADSDDTASNVPAGSTDHFPLTVTDQAGRQVTIAETPRKLVSGYYISTSLLIALDLEDKLVGIEAKADKRAIYKLSAPQLTDLPNVGSAKEFDLEGCAALEPDLVILPLKLRSAAETLESLGIPVLLVNPENQALLTEMINLVAAATGTQAQAQSLLDFTAAQEERLTQVLADAERPSVYLAGNSSMLSTAGSAMYQSDMIRLAGGANVAAEITDAYWVEISYEQLLAWNPDIIILASDAEYTVDDVLADSNLIDCTAVVNRNVYQMPDKAEAWDSPVPSGILGSIWLSGILHPDLCPESDCAALIDEYYETFYGFVYSEN